MRRPKPLSIYQLLDSYCPRFQETKPGSNPMGSAVLAVYPLLDGRFVWQTAYTRAQFADGTRADWWLGNSPVAGVDAHVCDDFTTALNRARAELASIPLPQWAN